MFLKKTVIITIILRDIREDSTGETKKIQANQTKPKPNNPPILPTQKPTMVASTKSCASKHDYNSPRGI